jgi:hypothetical protein
MVGLKMNERIRQLAEQAGYLPDSFGIGHWDMPECKKFAQLIVQECAELVDGRTFLYAGNTIREHFGIEE